MKKYFLFLFLIIILSLPAFSQQENQLSFTVQPSGSIPLGSSSELFKTGIGAEASASFIPDFLQIFGIESGGSFLNLPLTSANSIWLLSGWAGPVFRMPLGDRFSVYAKGRAGYYHWGPVDWDAEGSTGGGFITGASAGALFRIAGPFTAGLTASYGYYAGLYNGLSINLAVKLDFPGLPDENIDIELNDIKLMPLYPVLYGYYASSPIGTVKVKNTSGSSVKNINVEFFMERYMDNPMEVSAPFNLTAGEEKEIPLYALFSEELMEITEGTKASAKITITQNLNNKELTKDYTGVIDFYNRNAMSWTDDRRIASFITAKDPVVLNFSKNIMNWMKAVQNPAVDENLQKAMATFEAVKIYGIRYEIDPATPFSELSEEAKAIDFLQFPRQTLQYTNGDCDDLTALFCTLLEAVGVETAFITVPGHIFAAFALKSPPSEVKRTFTEKDDLIFAEDKVWFPIEITMFQEDFQKAWQYGAKEWRENLADKRGNLYPVREAWSLYQAVGFKDDSAALRLPDRTAVTSAFRACINSHVEREIYPQVERLKEKIGSGRNKTRYQNQLGVVYARYGLYEEAETEFLDILKQEEYIPALNNIAGIHFLNSKYEDSLQYYERAIENDEQNKAALLGIARCSHELENYYLSKKTFTQLSTLDPQLAEQFAYLDMKGEEATRAADASEMKNRIFWEDEE
jgi:tetratricopeptide (TPR) repeat protein